MARRTRPSRGEGAADATAAGPNGRVPPHDLEAEKAVLSALLLDNQAIHAVYLELRPDDFYHPAHRLLYRAMLSLREANEPVDLHTLSDHLTTRKLLDEVGGPVALAEIADYEATAAHVVHHARIVSDKAIKRRLIAAATEIVEQGYEQTDAAQQLMDVAEARILDVGKTTSRVTFRSLHDEMQDTFDYVEALMNRGGELTGLPTGFQDLDEMTGGLQAGELIVLAARPSMGKTALALNMARNAAVDHGRKVAVFSLEMITRSLVLRLLAAEARIDFATFRRGFIAVNDHARLVAAAGRLAHADVWIDDSGLIGLLEMKAKCRRMRNDKGLDLVIVDYLQLARGDGHYERREQEISEISRGLKALAKELDLPVVALSQLNRGPEVRGGVHRRPMLADLRESGAIEQDADVIAFIYRDEVYNPDTEDQGVAELIVAKQRNGPTGTLKLRFEARYARFDNLSPREDGPPAGGRGFDPPEGSAEPETPF